MTIILILFFLSLIAIMFMVGKRLILLKEKQITIDTNVAIDIPDLQDIKIMTFRGLKKYGYITLVILIRFYVIASNFLRKKYQEIKSKILIAFDKYTSSKVEGGEKKEVSKFLKTISDYKKQIKRIKNRIEKEEELK